MLKLIYLSENFDLARFALAHWPHDNNTLDARFKWFRISSNAVYPFDREGQLCFLRMTPAEEKSAAHIRAELDFLAHLQQADYPALRPIPAGNGEYLLTLSTPWGIWHACAFTGVPGKNLESIPLTAEILLAYGSALGQLHRISMALAAPPDRPSWQDILTWCAPYLTEEYLRSECAAVADALAQLLREQHTYGLVHYDFEPDNVFYDGTRCHAIDFDDCMLHFYAIDLLQALDEIEPEYHVAFLQGYHAACPESGARESDFPLMRRFRDLYSLARLRHALSEIPSSQPDWMPQLIDLLKEKARSLEEQILHR